MAYVGLVKAVNGFDPSHERDFLSYAVPTVTGEVKRHFRDFGWTVRPPRRIQELQGQISRTSNEMSQHAGGAPRGRSEVAEKLGVDVEQVDRGAGRGRRVHTGVPGRPWVRRVSGTR